MSLKLNSFVFVTRPILSLLISFYSNIFLFNARALKDPVFYISSISISSDDFIKGFFFFWALSRVDNLGAIARERHFLTLIIFSSDI
jgi:hypothetical protein